MRNYTGTQTRHNYPEPCIDLITSQGYITKVHKTDVPLLFQAQVHWYKT